MGKHRIQRRKLHVPSKNAEKKLKNEDSEFDATMDTSQPIFLQPSDKLFADIDIDLDNLNKNIADDTRSVKSFKSLKSEAGANKSLLKKDKIKLRREMLLKKIDTVNQMKLENKRRRKRKNVSIIGDTNPLHDALPTLESLLTSRKSVKANVKPKRKCVEKASKRKKEVIDGVQLFKKLLTNKQFQKDPFKTITEHVKNVVGMKQVKYN